MKSGQCPKCNNPTVYKKTEGIAFGDGRNIKVYTSAVTMPVPTEDYVCTTCGYFERYVMDKEKLQAVTETWEKID